MGLKGNLTTVNLATVFQGLARESSTGLLRIQAPEGMRFVELQDGAISIAGRSAGRIMLGDLLMSRGLLDDAGLAEGLRLQKESGKMLGQVLLESGLLTLEQLEDALRFQIEEEVCELFMLHEGEFDFLEGAGLGAHIAPGGGLVRLKLDLNTLLVEAARRAEEWKAVEQRIPKQAFLFQLTADGRGMVQSGEGVSAEGMILMRLIQAHRTVEAIVQKTCLGRFTTNSMLVELWNAGLIEPAPPSEYLNIAREHLRMSRLEEAQRVAEMAVELNPPEEKEKARTLLAEIEKARRPSSTGSASVKVSADPKVRSEVIRRAPANLMLKKERSSLPLVIVAILVLAGLGAGVYFIYFRHSAQSEYTVSRRQLEEASLKAQELIAADKYEEALQLLREFRTFDSDVQKLATELFERRQGDVEAVLRQAMEKFQKFNAGGKGGSSEELQAAAMALQRLITISVLDQKVEAERNKVRAELDAYFDGQRAVQLETRLKEIEAAADKGSDAQQQVYEKLLAEDPPEPIAVKVRDQLNRLQRQRIEAARLLKRAHAMQAAGDLQTAKNDYGEIGKVLPGSAAATEADKELAAATQALTAAQAEFERIEGLVAQNKTADARTALLEFLKAKPVYPVFFRALSRLQALAPVDEAGPSAALKAAVALYDRQPPDPAGARKRIIELVEQQPVTRTALAAALRVDVNSQPEGATVSINGKPGGTTPAQVDVPALGLVCIAFSKEGFRNEELVWSNFREERVMVTLDRLCVATARLPVAARGGMAVEAEQMFVAGPSVLPGKAPEVVLCARQNLKVRRRFKLQDAVVKEEKAAPALPPFALFGGEVFVAAPGSFLLRVSPVSGAAPRFPIGAPAASSPVFFEDRDELGGTGKGQLMGLATRQGYECYQLDSGKSRKRFALPAADQPALLGAAFDGEMIYIPRRDNTVHAIIARTGVRKWGATIDAELRGSPALYPFTLPGASRQGTRTSVAVCAANGRVVALDAQNGMVLWRADGSSPATAGPESVGAGLVVLRQNGTAELLSVEKKGAPLWSKPLFGEPVLPPFVVRDRSNGQGKAIAVCVKTAPSSSPYALVVLSPEDGAVLWRAALPAAPVALAADEERLYLSTDDAGVMVFETK